MAPNDLGHDRRVDVGQVEDAVLGRVLGVEHDLQQQVAELLGELRRRALLERVVDLVRLLEQELAQGQVVLLAIPRAAVGRAQAAESQGTPTGWPMASSGASGGRGTRPARTPRSPVDRQVAE